MPSPVYILCSESTLEDKSNNLVSMINVLERLSFFRHGVPQATAERLFACRVTAVWMKEPGDSGKTFDWELRVRMPASGEERRVAGGQFSYGDDPRKMLWRFSVNFEGGPPTDGSGIIRFQHRVREVETENWQSQEYPLIIEEANAATAAGAAEAP